MLWVITILGVPTVVYVLATNSQGLTRPATLLTIAITAGIVLVTCIRQWPFALRAITFIAVAYLGGLLCALHFGYTLGTGLLMLLVVVACGLFFGRGWLWGGLLVTGVSLVSVGVLHTTGVIATQQLNLVDFGQGWNIVRVTLVYVVLAGTLAVSVSYVVRCIERSLRETSEALAHYEAERRGRSEAEAALQASEETYRQLVENINDVIYAIDDQGVFTYLSPAVETQSGYQPSELIGRKFLEFVYEADRNRIRHAFATTLEGHFEPREYRIVIKSGEIRWIRSSSRTISHGNRVVGLQGVYMDITEKRELEAQRRQTHKMEAMGTLAGGIAHEFNNILSAILGFTDLTQRELPVESSARANLEYVLQASYRAKELVQQILAFSRPDDAARHPLSVSQTVHEVLALLRASLPTTIDIRLDLHEPVGPILANPTQLYQVLMNLCANAEYAMRERGGILEIRVDAVRGEAMSGLPHLDLQPGSWVRLTVRDTGDGIAPAIADRIFDPFFTTKGVGEGSGMGLAIVHGIVSSHGGVITVESLPGEGTTCLLYFPQLVATAGDGHESLPGACSTGAGRVLFVDDEEMIASLGQKMLEHLGYEVVTFTRSLAALAAFEADPYQFDVVVTDQTMPEMTGVALVAALRRVRPDIPIVLCTGFSHLVNEEKARALGVDAFVMKPWERQDVAMTLERVLQARATRKT